MDRHDGFAGGSADGIQDALEQLVRRCKEHGLLGLGAGAHDSHGHSGQHILREDPRWAAPVAGSLGLDGDVVDTGEQPGESGGRLSVEAGRGRCSRMPSRTAGGRLRPPNLRQARCNRNYRRCIRLHYTRLTVLMRRGQGDVWSRMP